MPARLRLGCPLPCNALATPYCLSAHRGIVDTSLGGLPGSQSGPPAWGLSFSNPGDGAPQAAGGKGLPGVNGGRASRTFTGPDGQPVPAPPAHPHGLNECASEPIPKLPPTTGTHHDTPFFAGLERGPSMGFIDGSLFDNVGLTIGDEEDMHHHHRAASIPVRLSALPTHALFCFCFSASRT